MTHPAIHRQFTLERAYRQSPERVYAAFSDPKKKRRWFAEGAGFVIDDYSLEFRIGGFERTRFRFGKDGPPMTNDCVYTDLVPNERLVFAYWMTIGGAPLSSSHASIELFAQPNGGTLLKMTEHDIFLNGEDGVDDRKKGTADLLERLAEALG